MVDIEDEEGFRRDLALSQISNMYLYAGVTRQAAEIIPDEMRKALLSKLPQQDQPSLTLPFKDMEEEYVGIYHEMDIIGEVNRLAVFQGLSEKVYKAMEKRDMPAIIEHGNSLYEKARNLPHDNDNEFHHEGENSSANHFSMVDNTFRSDVYGRDGTVLRIEVSR